MTPRTLQLGLRFALAIALACGFDAAAADWPDLSAAPPVQGGGQDDAALVVAIDHYAAAPAVPGAVQNADDWYAYLTQTRRVPATSIRLLRDAEGTAEKIKKNAEQVAELTRPGGTLWFIFIGHGAPAKNGKDGLLVGFDAQQEADSLYARSVPQAQVLGLLAKGKQKRTLAIIDACFSGKSSNGSSLVKGLQPLIPLTSDGARLGKTLLLSAGKADQFAGALPGAERPAFSYLVLGGLRGWADKNADAVVTPKEVVEYAQGTLATLAKDRTQTPELLGTDTGEPIAFAAAESGPELSLLLAARPAPGGAVVARDATPAPAVARPTYSKRCDDFAAKGWSGLDDCLQDGRWHEVLAVSNGNPTFGTVAGLKLHVHAGADVKVTVDEEATSWPLSIQCLNVSQSDGNPAELQCGNMRRDDGATVESNNVSFEWNTFGTSGWVNFTPYPLNGGGWKTGGSYRVAWTFHWFVRY